MIPAAQLFSRLLETQRHSRYASTILTDSLAKEEQFVIELLVQKQAKQMNLHWHM